MTPSSMPSGACNDISQGGARSGVGCSCGRPPHASRARGSEKLRVAIWGGMLRATRSGGGVFLDSIWRRVPTKESKSPPISVSGTLAAEQSERSRLPDQATVSPAAPLGASASGRAQMTQQRLRASWHRHGGLPPEEHVGNETYICRCPTPSTGA